MSALTPKPQPDAVTYGPDALELFTRYTRASYRTATGKQAPAADPTRPMKRWFLPDAVDSMTLSAWEFPPTGSPIYVPKTYTAAELKAVNLPGTFEYPKYVIAPSGAFTLQGQDNSPAGVDEEWLSTHEQAEAVADALRTAGWPVGEIVENKLSGIFTIMYKPEEKRRIWEIEIPGGVGSRNVGKLIVERNNAGVGAPGKWSTPSDSSSPIWFSAVPQSGELILGEVPIPQRNLLPNEKWVQNIFSGWTIARTDKEQPGTGSSAVPADPAISAMLQTILDNTEAIKNVTVKTYAAIGGNV